MGWSGDQVAMASRRQRRVSELIHEELSEVLQKKVSDPRLKTVTVTAVEISPDLRRAHVYISTLGDQETNQAALTALERAGGYLRREVGSHLSLRYIPTLTFHLDRSLQHSERIMELLRQIEEEATHEQDG